MRKFLPKSVTSLMFFILFFPKAYSQKAGNKDSLLAINGYAFASYGLCIPISPFNSNSPYSSVSLGGYATNGYNSTVLAGVCYNKWRGQNYVHKIVDPKKKIKFGVGNIGLALQASRFTNGYNISGFLKTYDNSTNNLTISKQNGGTTTYTGGYEVAGLMFDLRFSRIDFVERIMAGQFYCYFPDVSFISIYPSTPNFTVQYEYPSKKATAFCLAFGISTSYSIYKNFSLLFDASIFEIAKLKYSTTVNVLTSGILPVQVPYSSTSVAFAINLSGGIAFRF